MTKSIVKEDVKTLKRFMELRIENEKLRIVSDKLAWLKPSKSKDNIGATPSLIREGGVGKLPHTTTLTQHQFSHSEAVESRDPSLLLRMTGAEESRKNFPFSIFHFQFKKTAFTLAETLITLGVIGVVAAITMPVLINKYRAKVYETQFKKSYNNISKALLYTQNSLGVDNLWATYVVYDSTKGGYYIADEFLNEFNKNLGVKTTVAYYPIKNYSGTVEFTHVCGSRSCDHPTSINILPDGSSIGVRIDSAEIIFWSDINGPYKGPNRLGHDIFRFHIAKGSKLEPTKQTRLYTEEELEKLAFPFLSGNPCSKKSNQELNGMGCAWYALNNVNPDDETKTYWDNLPK